MANEQQKHIQQEPTPYFPSSISDEFRIPILYGDNGLNYGTKQPPKIITEPKSSNVKSVVATLLAAVGSLCFGYCLGYSSPALQDLKEENGKLHLDDVQGAFFASLVTLGAIIGCPIGGVLIDVCGRKSTIILSAIPFEAGWLMIRFADSTVMLDAGRMLTGLGCGMIAVSYPVYVAEIASSKLRGALGGFHQTAITTGILLSYVFGVIFSWRDMAVAGIVMPAFLVFIMLFMTETPRWYIQHNKRCSALNALLWLRGKTADIDSECYETEQSIDMHTKMSLREFFKPSIIRPLVIGVGLMIFQQTCGAIVIVMNCASIFASAGISDAKVVSISIAGVQLIVNFIASGIIDKVGRRTLLLTMAVVMAVCHFGIGTFFELSNDETCNSTVHHKHLVHSIPACEISWLAITCLLIFTFAFSLSWGPVPWVVMSEIFPLRARSIAGTIATISAFTSAFVLLWCYDYMQDAMSTAGLYWFYGSFCLVSFFFVYILVPETKGQTLEEIEHSFEPSRAYTPIE